MYKYVYTIITVCYNAEKEIERTMRSVLQQTFSKYEYIIIDGASSDNTLSIVHKIEAEYPNRHIRVISEPDNGIYDAMNKGIKLAQGNWINFMNSGDVFYANDVLENLPIEVLENVGMIFGDVVHELDGVKYRRIARPFYEHLPLHQSMGFTHQSSFVRNDLARKYPFDLKYYLAADYNMAITLFRNGYKFYYAPMIISEYNLEGISVKKKKQYISETYDIDYPNRNVLNKLNTNLKYYNIVWKSMLKRSIITIAPFLMSWYRNNRKRNQRIG